MSETKLKPCPFCGGKATVDDDGQYQWVECESCGARAGIGRDDVGPDEAAWNKRFVCPDKNGKAVYAGDKVKWDLDAGIGILSMVGLQWVVMYPDGDYVEVESSEIELIESEAPNDK